MYDVLIVGAGLTGLTCARALQEQGFNFLVLEAQSTVGGRVRSDRHAGFILDHGFQIFLTAYPEAQRWLDYTSLDLKPFYRGVRIQTLNDCVQLSDPLNQPQTAWETALAKLGSLEDKFRMLKFIYHLRQHDLSELWQKRASSTSLYLRQWGFSERFIQSFLRPFFAGVFLDPDLQTSSRSLDFVFKMFLEGQAVVPAQGMQAIPEQLRAALRPEQIQFQAPVAKVEPQAITLENGTRLQARAVVVACDANAAAKLLHLPPQRWNSSRTLYFAAEQSPLSEPILTLNGQGTGPVNNLVPISLAAPSYAPEGQHLLSVSVLSPWADTSLTSLLQEVQKQLLTWFGSEVKSWQLLKDYWLPHSLPEQSTIATQTYSRTRRLETGLYLGGDFTETASINGAMAAGRRLAELLLQDLQV